MGACVYNLPTLPAGIVNGRDVPMMPDGRHFDMDALRATAPDAIVWSGKGEPLAIGTRVRINFNGFGEGTVRDYFVEHGFLGVRVFLDKQPDWHKKQRPGQPWALVFGNEVDA